MMAMFRRVRRLRKVSKWAAFGIAAWALGRELQLPSDQRTWHGKVAGFIPYDFRIPSVRRIKDTYWNPKGHTLIPAKVFGIGWTVNIGKAWEMLRNRPQPPKP